MNDRLDYIRTHAEIAACQLEAALLVRGRSVTVTAAPNSLTVWCGTHYLGRVTYEALAEGGINAAADALIAQWVAEITTAE